jgi:hypothetical protein
MSGEAINVSIADIPQIGNGTWTKGNYEDQNVETHSDIYVTSNNFFKKRSSTIRPTHNVKGALEPLKSQDSVFKNA